MVSRSRTYSETDITETNYHDSNVTELIDMFLYEIDDMCSVLRELAHLKTISELEINKRYIPKTLKPNLILVDIRTKPYFIRNNLPRKIRQIDFKNYIA